MDSNSLAPQLDPFKDCRTRRVVRAAALVVDESAFFRGRPEASHHGVVVAVGGTAHALRPAMLIEKVSTAMTCILHAMRTISATHEFDMNQVTMHDLDGAKYAAII